jgi:hypothetical protein
MTTPPSQQHRQDHDDTADAAAPAVFVDENPGIVLVDPYGPTTALSYWRSLLSPAGTGSVLALWQRQRPVELWTDNPALAELIARTFLRHWAVLGPSLRTPLDPQAARFQVDCDGRHRYRLQARTADTSRTLLAHWLNWQPARRQPEHQHPGVEHGIRPLTISSVIALCDTATIVIDGRPLGGSVDQQAGPTFIALAESWTTPAR